MTAQLWIPLPALVTDVCGLLFSISILLTIRVVAAVLLFGDVRHVANQPYNVLAGSAYDSGSSTRSADSVTLMNRFSNIMRSYCDGSDPICATSTGGPYVVANHLSYFDLYSDEAADWVKTIL